MYTTMLVIHIMITIALIGVILVQRGRSGGLVEALGGVESIFGTKTSSFFVKTTVVLATLFFLSCILMTYISREKGKSLMEKYKSAPGASDTKEAAIPVDAEAVTEPKAEIPKGVSSDQSLPESSSQEALPNSN